MQPRAPVSYLSFLGPEGRPQNGGFFSTLSTKSQTFYTINCFFLIAPRDLHYLLGQCAALRRQIAQIRTPF